MDLPLDDHRVDDIAEIIDGGPALDPRHAGIGIDLDLMAQGQIEIQEES